MMADVHILHESDVYRILDFRCHCNVCSLTDAEYNNNFCVSFTRKGFFEYRTFKRKDEVHIGRILISKPEFEHTTRHIDNQPDITSVFEFKKSFYERLKREYFPDAGWFLQSQDMHAIMLACSVEADYLHHHIIQLVRKRKLSLQIDELVMQLLNKILHTLANASEVTSVPEKLKQHHLGTIERAMEHMMNNFSENISLNELAEHCFVSPFHFSRIFKSILNVSPHQYLLSTRLHHARILITSTDKPVSDVAFASGFNSLEHFVTAYKQAFKLTPSQQRAGTSSKLQASI